MTENRCSNELSELLQSILANAFDYADTSANEYVVSRTENGKLKYAVLHLWSAIQLLLKCRVIFTDWKRVVKCGENKVPIFSQFCDGGYKTIYHASLVRELRSILEEDENHNDSSLLELIDKYKGDLEALRKLRNKLEHFTDTLDPASYEPTLASVWQFTFEAGTIIADQILCNIPHSDIALYDRWNAIKQQIAGDKRFSVERLGEIQNQIDAYKKKGVILIQCYNCSHFAIPVDNKLEPCLFCKKESDGACFFEIWWENETGEYLTQNGVPEGHPWNAGMCPNCEERGYYVMTDEAKSVPSDVLTLCFSCGYSTRKNQSVRKEH